MTTIAEREIAERLRGIDWAEISAEKVAELVMTTSSIKELIEAMEEIHSGTPCSVSVARNCLKPFITWKD